MATIYHLPQELLQQIVAASSSDAPEGSLTIEESETATSIPTLKSLSTTNQTLRAFALPHLWRNAHIYISFGALSDSLSGVDTFLAPSHPVRQYAQTLDLAIDSQQVTLSRYLLASLDLRLARAVTGMVNLQSARIQMRTAFDFPRTMRAVLMRLELKSLTISARGNLNLPAVRAGTLETLLVHSDVGSCRLDLSSFPNLKDLSLNMEDNSSCQSWVELRFPPQMWSTLESLSLRGFVLDPFGPLARLAESLRYNGRMSKLKTLSYHLARDEQDATFAWQLLSQQMQLTSLSFTLPILFDARYARKMIRAFSHLQTLELFAFSRAAAWQWPDPFEAYIGVFAELKNLRALSINHNELTVASLPLSLPLAHFPMESNLPTEIALPVDFNSSGTGTTQDTVEGEGMAGEEEGPAEEEIVVYGPLGTNFCPCAAPEDLELQAKTARALINAIPTLEQVKFEPGLTERAGASPFAYKISETLYSRSELCSH